MDWNHPLHPQKNAKTHNKIVALGKPKNVNLPGVNTKKLNAKQILARPARIKPVGKNFLYIGTVCNHTVNKFSDSISKVKRAADNTELEV